MTGRSWTNDSFINPEQTVGYFEGRQLEAAFSSGHSEKYVSNKRNGYCLSTESIFVNFQEIAVQGKKLSMPEHTDFPP